MNRREFVGGLFAGAGALALSGCRCPFCGDRTRFTLGMAGYTLHSFKTDEALAFMQKMGFHDLCVKSMHLPFEATPAQIAEFRRKCEDHGVTPYGVGPIYMEGLDLRKYFDYAAELGVGLIVGVPGKKLGPQWTDTHSDRKTCEVVSDLVQEYDVKFAIHNHGRNPKTGNPNLYPAIPETFEFIKDLDSRIGLCVDWAYTYADGLDCRTMARVYGDRIYDGHVRCIADPTNGSSGVNPAQRCFDYDVIFQTLREIGYDGHLGLELANAFPKNPQWIAESRDYFTSLM